MPKRPVSSGVYFLKARGFDLVKIGFARRIDRRICAIQCASPIQLVLLGWVPGGRSEELAFHHRWIDLRSHGEWFALRGDLSNFVRRFVGPSIPVPLRTAGRPLENPPTEIRAMLGSGLRVKEIAARLGVHRMTVYRARTA